MKTSFIAYATEHKRNSPIYASWYDRCSRHGVPFLIVSEYRSRGTVRAKITVDMITAKDPYLPDGALRWFRHMVAEHRRPGMRVHIDPVRSDVYGMEVETAHRVVQTLIRLIEEGTTA